MKAWNAKSWLEGEVEQMESLYGNTRSEALEFIEGQLKSDEYHEDLSDTQVSQVLREIQTVNNDQTGKEKIMSSKKTKRIEAGRKAAEEKKDGKAPVAETKAEKAQEKEDKVLKISRKDAANVLNIVGFKETRKYDNALLSKRLGKLKIYMESYEGTLTGDQQEIVDKIIKAGPDGFTVTGEEPKDAKSTAAEGGKKDKPAKVKKASGESGVKKSGESREGSVLSLIVAMIGKKPATKDEMHEMLMKKFPDRNADTMRNTIAWNLSVGVSRHGVSLKKGNDGKWSISKGK